jgi:S1-C subfamily serine protease
MSDDVGIPGQQAFDLPADAVPSPDGSPSRRRLVAGGTVVATALAIGGWGLSDALANGSTHGFPHVAGLSAGGSIDATAAESAVDDFVVDIDAVDGYSGEEDAGTGSVITSDGDVLTNNHVVAGATSITVTLVSTGKTYHARVLGTDATQDVALLKLKGASGLPTLHAGNADDVKAGIAVAAVGNALGKGGTPSVTTGSITGTGRSITASDGDGAASENLTGLLETDADIVSGDSGGPLVDSSGQVIGMDTAASSAGSDGEDAAITSSNDGYAIPITTALDIARKIAAGKASSTIVIGRPGFLGLELGSATGSPSTQGGDGGVPGYGFGGPGGGDPGYGLGGGQGGSPLGTSYSTSTSEQTAQGSALTVAGVIANTPAADAGITAGDTITSLSGTSVSTEAGLSALLDKTHGGDRVTVGWTDTSGAAHQATVTLIPGPAA